MRIHTTDRIKLALAAAVLALSDCTVPAAIADDEPQSGFPVTGTVADVLSIGINLGNTFDAPTGKARVSGVTKESYFDDYKGHLGQVGGNRPTG